MTLDETFERLRSANQPVPTPLRLPTPAEVDAAERDIGVRFHPDYRRFQLEVSNVSVGVLEPSLVLPYMMPYLDLRTTVEDARSVGVPRDVLPFCNDNSDFFVIDADGRIGFWDHHANSVVSVNKCLADWIAEVWLGTVDE